MMSCCCVRNCIKQYFARAFEDEAYRLVGTGTYTLPSDVQYPVAADHVGYFGFRDWPNALSVVTPTLTNPSVLVYRALDETYSLDTLSYGRLVKKLADGSAVIKTVVNDFRFIGPLATNTLIGIEYQEGKWVPYKVDCDAFAWVWE